MNYPNLPNSALEITQQPEVKEITNELLKQLQHALKSNTLFTEQVELSLKGIVRILEVLLSLDFFKNANEIDSSLRNSIEWLTKAGESLKNKMKEYESFFNDFNTSMKANEQEVSAILNANTENIKSEIKKLENQLIETATRLLTSYQLKRHGVNSVNVRNGESPITYQDIANYRSFINGADDVFVDNNNLIAFKQINGYAVVVEQAVNRKSELVLKTMYKSNGEG
ncbi:hypothetical protein HpBT170_12880 [Helicobacter pylori]